MSGPGVMGRLDPTREHCGGRGYNYIVQNGATLIKNSAALVVNCK